MTKFNKQMGKLIAVQVAVIAVFIASGYTSQAEDATSTPTSQATHCEAK